VSDWATDDPFVAQTRTKVALSGADFGRSRNVFAYAAAADSVLSSDFNSFGPNFSKFGPFLVTEVMPSSINLLKIGLGPDAE